MAVKFLFLILPRIQLLDLAGAEQVIHEAIGEGADFEIHYCSINKRLVSTAGLHFGKLPHFTRFKLKKGDFIFIPGPDINYLTSEQFQQEKTLFKWIKQKSEEGITICSICSGAYVLAYSGILNNKNCTTHWKKTTEMQRKFPLLKVQENVLFTKHENIYTSAGIAAGIDLALYILEELKGPYFAHKIARELVIYNRRSGNQPQQSDFLSFRNHIHAGIHKVQDWVHKNLHKKITIPELAHLAGMSGRNFTRVFRKETATTVNQYITTLRKERIRELLKNPDLSRHQIARKCGLKSERQISRIIQKPLLNPDE